MNYIPHTDGDRERMLKTIGVNSLAALFQDVPEKVKLKKPFSLPSPLSEPELHANLLAASQKNTSPAFLGGGSYSHFIPSVVKQLVSRSEFYTAYTPYQAELSQGMLQVIYEYQTLLCSLTGMDVANASLYDGATALAEACFLACRVTGRKEILVSAALHPEYRKVLKTYVEGAGLRLKEVPFTVEGKTERPDKYLSAESACFALQQPNFFGCIESVGGLAETVHAQGALLVASADPISLGILAAPGKYGADVVVGEGQALGNPVAFGGPGLGIFAAKKEYLRQLPGRIVGLTTDQEGRRGFCLTLQTREQHIRREKAASNICTNEALAALAATLYLSVMGKAGLRKVAELCVQKTNYLRHALTPLKKLVFSTPSFKELVIKSEHKIGLDLSLYYPEFPSCRLISLTELTGKEALDELIKKLSH